MRRLLIMLCTIGLLALGTNARAAAGWEIPLTVRAGNAVQHLALGERVDATDGIDGLYDVPALPGGSLRASFDLAGGHFWRDIRPLSSDHQRWTLSVAVAQKSGEEVTVHWGNMQKKGLQARLTDPLSGRIIDAATRHEYHFRSNGSRTLILDITRQGEMP